MPKPQWIDVCDEIAGYLNESAYTGPLNPKGYVRRDYLPYFDDAQLGSLQVVVAPKHQHLDAFGTVPQGDDRGCRLDRYGCGIFGVGNHEGGLFRSEVTCDQR